MVAREVAVTLVKPIASASLGVLAMVLPEVEALNELLGIVERYETIKTVIAIVGGGFFFWKAVMIATKTIKEKELANKERQIDIERKTWELMNEKKKAQEEGLKGSIDELIQILKTKEK
jgi:hypothetical protein